MSYACVICGKSTNHYETNCLGKRVPCHNTKCTDILKKAGQPPCTVGHCLVKDVHYAGGDDTVFDKIDKGICPICGGPLTRQQ